MAIMLLAACGDTGNEADDAKSAQRLLPNLVDFSASDIDATVDGAFAAVGGAALMGGQFGLTAVIA